MKINTCNKPANINVKKTFSLTPFLIFAVLLLGWHADHDRQFETRQTATTSFPGPV